MTHAQYLAIAAVLRDARLCCPSWTAEDMRCYIARDMARELQGIMNGFDKQAFLTLCDIPEDRRQPV